MGQEASGVSQKSNFHGYQVMKDLLRFESATPL
jgi:hypothetical protein